MAKYTRFDARNKNRDKHKNKTKEGQLRRIKAVDKKEKWTNSNYSNIRLRPQNSMET